MAELLPSERLQPSLLDRLCDDDPANSKESREQRVLSVKRLRQSVLRDIAWLLNAVCLESVQSLEKYPEVARSVLNFGIPDLSGHTLSTGDIDAIEKKIRKALIDFEPRILPNTLRVKVVSSDAYNHNAMNFDIEGDLWMQPLPLRLYLKTQLDLETGNFVVVDNPG
jgi:type VI secretion system protein ImpF